MKINLIILIFLINFIFTFQNEIYWNQTQILIANDGKKDDDFGSFVDIKGNISVIGAPFANVENYEQGKAYIFQNNGTNWNQKQILIANDGKENDQFGSSIAISNDEKYIFIGSPLATVENNSQQGKVYIYENNGTFYNLIQILIPNDGETIERFGNSISISNDSSFIAIGAPYARIGNNTQQGKVYIFQNNGTFWNQYQILIANNGKAYEHFGFSVTISNDSSFLVIGSPQANVGENLIQGKAYIFQNNGTFWNLFQILIANDGKTGDRFGFSISLSQNFILIGAYYATVGNNLNQGKAYIFQNNGTYWNQYQILIANNGKSNDEFGTSVSISNDEKFILIGSPQSIIGENIDQGKAYIFQNNGINWNQKQILIANDGKSNDQFGTSVSISNYFALIGSPYANVSNNISQGKAYIFDLDSKPNPNPNPSSISDSKTIIAFTIIIPILVILIGIILAIFFIRRKKIQFRDKYQKPEEIIMDNPLFSDNDDDKEF